MNTTVLNAVYRERRIEKLFRICVLALVLGAVKGAAVDIIMSERLGLSGQPGWAPTLNTTYHPGGAAYAIIPKEAESIVGTVTLPRAYAAGSAVLWLRGTTVSYPGGVTLSIGSNAVRTVLTNGVWNRVVINPSQEFSAIQIAIHRLAPEGSVHGYHIYGIAITTNFNLSPVASSQMANSGDLFLDFTRPEDAPAGTAQKGNILPNSSFELGMSYGWSFARGQVSTNSATWMSEGIDGTQAYKGTSSVRISDAYARYRLKSPVLRLPGYKAVRSYTLSFYAKGSGPTLLAEVAPVVPVPAGFPAALRTNLNFGAPGNSWVRYSRQIRLAGVPSPEVYVDFYHVGTGSSAIWIDCVQLEEGELSDYAPRSVVEIALKSSRPANVFSVSEAAVLNLDTYNYASDGQARSIRYEVYDWLNRRVAADQISLVVPPGLSTRSLSLNVAARGSYRLVSWAQEDSVQPVEMVFSFAPLDSLATMGTEAVVGVHPSFTRKSAETMRNWGFAWARSLSPGGFFRWNAIEKSEGVFDWSAPDLAVSQVDGRLQILANLHEPPMPAWALTNGFPRLDRWSNYIHQIVVRYKDRIHFWEDHNEPQYHWSAANLAKLTATTASAVKAADPSAFFVGLGGMTVLDYAKEVWRELPEGARAQVDAVSVHFYPPGSSWMASESPGGGYAAYREWASQIGRPLWNTESGTWTLGSRKTEIMGVASLGVYAFPCTGEEVFTRGNYLSAEKTLRTAIRSLGHGFSRYFYYDARLADYSFTRADTQPTIFDYDDSLRPDGVALMWAQHFVGAPSAASRVTNSVQPLLEGYVFTKPEGALLVCWNQDKTNRALATGVTGFDVYDMMGSLVAADSPNIIVGRRPSFWVSRTLGPAALASAFSQAAVSGARDSEAPGLSLDASPRGEVSARDVPFRFRWTAVDDTYVNTEAWQSAVLTRYRLVGLSTDWSGWSAERSLVLPFLRPGTYSLEVQAVDAEGNGSATVVGPAFIVPLLPLRPASGWPGPTGVTVTNSDAGVAP